MAYDSNECDWDYSGKCPLHVVVYNESPNKQVDALSRECYLVTEKLVVEIIVVNNSQGQLIYRLQNLLWRHCRLKFPALYTCKPNYAVTGESIHSNAQLK